MTRLPSLPSRIGTVPSPRMALPTLLAGLLAAGAFAPDLAAQEILISGGTVVTSEGRFAADVRVRDGTIVEIGTGLAAGADARVVNASGLLVMPGGVDPHVHLGRPHFATTTVPGRGRRSREASPPSRTSPGTRAAAGTGGPAPPRDRLSPRPSSASRR